HQVSFLSNLNSPGAVDLTLPDGQHLVSQVYGLSYYDYSSGQSVLIAEVKDSIGQLLASSNQVFYADAFSDFQAGVLYTYTRNGFEQDIVIAEQPPSPADYQLNPATTRLQVLTEFTNAPEPSVQSLTTADTNSPADQLIDF